MYPAHDYKGNGHSTIARELAENPRLQQRERAAFVDMMRSLTLTMPTHVTEALRSNMSGSKTVAQLLAEAAAVVPFMSLTELKARVEAAEEEFVVLDVRERDAYENGHIPRARLLPRGQLELRVNDDLPDPTRRIVAYCEYGRISTLATATLRELGYQRAVALDAHEPWCEAGYPLESGLSPDLRSQSHYINTLTSDSPSTSGRIVGRRFTRIIEKHQLGYLGTPPSRNSVSFAAFGLPSAFRRLVYGK